MVLKTYLGCFKYVGDSIEFRTSQSIYIIERLWGISPLNSRLKNYVSPYET
ncbi:hypothetical protein VDG1235_716 [Verrucomicrobiia bacterium DG1235]|nr:hypothetical protein VDG1235_716 [Verrucomicrobiae bacterium DG1235]